MKKILLAICTVALVTGMVNAQETMMSKKGTSIQPEANDWGIGIYANPFLEYFGNAFNHDFNGAPSWDFATSPMVITGVMVKDATTSYRVKVRLGISSYKNVYKVDDATSTAVPQAQKDETKKTKSKNIQLGCGIQKNRGKHRVRGIYGAEAMIGLTSNKTTNEFGNAFTATNISPVTSIPGTNAGGGSRYTERKSGSTFSFGVRGFIGAEYFFAPKISVSGEFGWGPAINSTGEGEDTVESLNTTANGSTTNTIKTGKSSSFIFDTDNNDGAINLNFYF